VHTRLRTGLMAVEVALSVVLLIGSGLLIRSFAALASVDPGFEPERVLTFRITANTGSQEKRRVLYSQVLQSVKALPGVESAAAVLIRPLSGPVGWDTVYTVEGQSPEEQKENPNGNYEAISPGYFRTMGIRLIAGRDFTGADTEGAPGVVILNEATAKRHFPDGSAAGRHVRLSNDVKAPWLTVVGVAADVRYREWEAIRPDFYVPYTQRAQHRSDFVVRTAGDPSGLIAAVRHEVFAVDPNLPISNVTMMSALVDRALSRSRFISTVLSVLAACALSLAAIGVYGVLSYTVAQRTGEIGVRMAVGATPGAIVRLVTAGGLRVAAAGGFAGLLASAALARTVASLLFGIEVWDPVAWITAFAVLSGTAVLACVLPAARAAAIDPARALASE
jgi:putative ABC transport system permease protein